MESGLRRSSDPSIQLPALFVVVKAILRDWSLRNIFLDILNRRGRTVDFVVDSWKRSGVEYRQEWNLYHGLAKVCLIDTVVSKALDAVGEGEALDDAKMADLIVRSRCVSTLFSFLVPAYLTKVSQRRRVPEYLRIGSYV